MKLGSGDVLVLEFGKKLHPKTTYFLWPRSKPNGAAKQRPLASMAVYWRSQERTSGRSAGIPSHIGSGWSRWRVPDQTIHKRPNWPRIDLRVCSRPETGDRHSGIRAVAISPERVHCPSAQPQGQDRDRLRSWACRIGWVNLTKRFAFRQENDRYERPQRFSGGRSPNS